MSGGPHPKKKKNRNPLAQYICYKSIVDRMDKNGEHVLSRKNVKKSEKTALHYQSVEPYWTCMIHVANNDKFDVKICTSVVINRTYIARCIINASWKMNQKIRAPLFGALGVRFEELYLQFCFLNMECRECERFFCLWAFILFPYILISTTLYIPHK